MCLLNRLAKTLWNVLESIEETVISRNSPGSEAPSFFGISVVRDWRRCAGREPHMNMLRMRTRVANGTFLMVLADMPSGPGAEPVGGKASLTSSMRIGVQRSGMGSFFVSAPGEAELPDVRTRSQNDVITSCGGVLHDLLSLRRKRRQFARLRWNACWTADPFLGFSLRNEEGLEEVNRDFLKYSCLRPCTQVAADALQDSFV